MRIVDIWEDATLSLEVYCGKDKMEFTAKARFTAFDAVFIDPIMLDEKIIDFNAENLIAHLILEVPGEIPVVFRDCKIKCVRYKKEVYHMISCARGGAKLNRRGRFRIPLGYTGSVRIGSEKGAYNIVAHDLSTSGFSFTGAKDTDEFIGERVWMVFIDTDEDLRFNLSGKIVRKQPWNSDRTLYGCTLDNANNMIGYYIAKKQRQAISLKTVKASSIRDLAD